MICSVRRFDRQFVRIAAAQDAIDMRRRARITRAVCALVHAPRQNFSPGGP
jgi:hypothetical protein